MPAISGKYKGLTFRSLLEYSFMKKLELMGFDLSVDVEYEKDRIPYRIGKGKQRKYIPDFYIPSLDEAFEVKYESFLKKRMNVAKIAAARDFYGKRGSLFSIITEDDIDVVPFKAAVDDPDIVWGKRGLRKKNKKGRHGLRKKAASRK